MFLARKGGLTYVARGDPVAYDADQTTLTIDGAYHALNLASIVPANAKLVHFRLRAANAATGKHVKLCKHGVANGFAIIDASIIVINLAHEQSGVLECTGQQIDYKCDAGAWTAIGFVVLGWFL
jgi:hypothetical protein